MSNINIKKTIIFIFTTFIFSMLSFCTRNILITKFNTFDFKIFQIDYIQNYGAAFSLFHTHTSFLITVSIIILLIVLYYIFSNIYKFTKSDFIFSSLLTAGIICNLAERLTDGFVTDYIRLNFVAFPIFNISDMFICIGAFMLICNILFSNEQSTDWHIHCWR